MKLKKIIHFLLVTVLMATILPVKIEATNKYVVEPKYDWILPFHEGRAFVLEGDKWGVIDETGKEIVVPQFDSTNNFYIEKYLGYKNGAAAVNKDGKWGFIDWNGKVIVPFKYDVKPGYFNEGLAAVYVDELGYGYVDKTGKEVVKPQYSEASDFKDGVAIVGSYTNLYKRELSIIDKTGEKISDIPYSIEVGIDPSGIMPPYYNSAIFSEGLTWFFKPYSDTEEYLGGKYGAINSEGKVVIDFIYDSPTSQLDVEHGNRQYLFTEGLAFVGSDLKRVIIDNTGKEVGKLSQYDGQDNIYFSYFSEGLAPISIYDEESYENYQKWGYVDRYGNDVIEAKYDYASDFSEGLAAIRIGDNETGKWGFIDKTGKEVIQPKYENVSSFKNGMAWIAENGKVGTIDKSGNYIITPQFDDAWYVSDGPLSVKVDGKWGVIANPLQTSGETSYPYDNYKDMGTHADIEADKTWTINFSQSVQKETVTNKSVRVLNQSGEEVEVEITVLNDGKSVQVSPPKFLYESNQTYYILIDNSIKSESGKELKEAVSLKFTIQ